MTDYQAFLLKLQQNLSILQEREAKYGGNAPLELLNQIQDYEQAIDLTEQAQQGQLTEVEWRATLKPLLVAIASRSGDAEAASSVTIGDIEGGIYNSKIAGRDIVENIFHIVSHTIPRPLLIVIGVAIVVMVILGIVNLQPVSIALFPTPTPTVTPLPFEPAKENETLILIATFHHTEGVADTDAHNEIRRAIEAEAAELGETNLRVEVEPTYLTGDDQDKARELGERYRASIIIWGSDTGVRVTVNFLNLKQSNYDAAEVKISEIERTQFANPTAYARFITNDLSIELTFLALYAVGRSYCCSPADDSEAIRLLEKALATLPSQMSPPHGAAEAYLYLGLLQSTDQQGQYDRAITSYTKAIEIDPKLTIAYIRRGLVYRKQNNYQQAIADYTKVIELDPKSPLGYYFRGNSYHRRGDYQQAILDYNQFMALEPKLAFGYYERGLAYFEQGNYQQAIADYNKATELNPKDANAWNNLCWTGGLVGIATKVTLACDQAVKLTPDDGWHHDSRGLVRSLVGDYQGAIEDFKFFIEWSKKSGQYDQYRRQREAWVAELEAGRNPFDEATLEELRKE